MGTEHHIHKHGYNFLFSHKAMVRELIECFVSRDIAAKLDFDDFMPMSEKSYLSKDFTEYAGDLLVKIGVKNHSEPMYIYLLIEFQSTPDHFMALRFLNYLTLFYLDYVKEHTGVSELPPVLPILLYNGKKNWNAKRNIKELIRFDADLSAYYPDFEYFPVLEKQYDNRELRKIGNAVSALFLVENAGKDEFEQLIEDLGNVLHDESPETVALFTTWLKYIVKNERIDRQMLEEVWHMRKEAGSMLVETLKEYREEIRLQGHQAGIREGRFDSARQLKILRTPTDIIQKATGLSLEEIEAL